jgi:hypothetical protein
MCTILIAPEMRTTRFADTARCQDFKFERAEDTEDRKRPLTMKWVVVADEHGNRRIEMHWAVAQPSTPSARCRRSPASVQRATSGRVIEIPARKHE